jgi:hypothetical protein
VNALAREVLMSPTLPAELTPEERLAVAKQYSQELERFCYRELHGAEEGSEHARVARGLLRQVIGVRRKLEKWRYRG